MPKVPFLDLQRQITALRPELDEAIARTLDSGRFILGPEVEAFEQETAAYLGVDHAVGVASGTDALWLSLRALGIGPGDAVLTSPFTFFATASAILSTGAQPLFVDIDPQTYNLDPGKVDEALAAGAGSRTIRALLPVHLYGQPADQDSLRAIAAERGLPVVEDAAQAMGAAWGGVKIGQTDGLACFSFFPSKNLGAFGDGGLVTTDDADLAERVRRLRAHGGTAKYHHGQRGTNSRLDALQAAILRIKLPHLDQWVQRRQAHAAAYDAAFAPVEAITAPHCTPGCSHAYHQYTIRVPAALRDPLAAHLAEVGIGHAIYYPVPAHLQEAVAELGYQPGDFPVAEQAAREVLSLPIFPELTDEERGHVGQEVSAFLSRERSS